ncbi:hypothetical protein JOF58_000831 [Streptomyces cinnamonensis]|nr:hypothetical protein [Streptomyces virginiae]
MAQGPEPYGDGYSVVRGIEAAVPARFGNRSILLTTKEGGLICVAPGDQPEVLAHFAEQAYAATDGLVAIGRPAPVPAEWCTPTRRPSTPSTPTGSSRPSPPPVPACGAPLGGPTRVTCSR